MGAQEKITVNGRTYAFPDAPLVVICCDGSEPEYMEVAMADGLMPNLKRIIGQGENLRAKSVIPSFTNPNNLSIVTGQPPAVHGICGNYLLDPESEVRRVLARKRVFRLKAEANTYPKFFYYVD